MNQKGVIQILIILGALLLIGAGAYYLGTKRLTNPSSFTKPTPKPTSTSFLGPTPIYHNFQDTTKGLEISLPDNLVACEYATSDVKLAQATSCNYTMDDGNSIGVDSYNQFHHPLFGPITPKTNLESLHNWVTRVAKGISANNNELNKIAKSEVGVPSIEQSDDISDIDSNTVLHNITITQKSTDSKQVSYSYYSTIYQQQGDNIIALSSGRLNTKGENVNELKRLLPLVRTIPITTGDLTLNVTWHHNGNSGIYVGYTGYLYQADQKTIATDIKTDSNGQYFVRLKPGTYYFLYPDGSSKQLQVQLGLNIIPSSFIDIATEKDMFYTEPPMTIPNRF